MWELDYKESWVPKNWCFWTMVLEKTLESPLYWKEIQSVHPKGNQSWTLSGRGCWERLKVGGEGDRGWDGWMASSTQWTWVWVNSRSWWWTGRPGVQRSMGSQKVWQGWATGLNWTETELNWTICHGTKLLQYYWLYSLCCTLYQCDLLILQLEFLTS